MSNSEFVKVYDSQSEAYREAFKVFLQHTDQKVNARAWLERFTQLLSQREVFIDVGAGTGQLTSWIAPEFERTIAIEPKLTCVRSFRRTSQIVNYYPGSLLKPGHRLQQISCSVLMCFTILILPSG